MELDQAFIDQEKSLPKSHGDIPEEELQAAMYNHSIAYLLNLAIHNSFHSASFGLFFFFPSFIWIYFVVLELNFKCFEKTLIKYIEVIITCAIYHQAIDACQFSHPDIILYTTSLQYHLE